MSTKISIRSITATLFLTILALAAANVISDIVAYITDSEEVFPLFNLGLDSNIPTWYAAFSILMCSGLLFLIAGAKRQREDAYSRHWMFLAVFFLLMSVDEVARMHETIAESLGSMLVEQVPAITENSPLYYSTWMIPGVLVILIIAVFYARFVRDLPPRTRSLFVAAGAVYLFGAMGMEAVGDVVIAQSGGDVSSTSAKVALALSITLEETLEMLGILVFLYALLQYSAKVIDHVSLSIGK